MRNQLRSRLPSLALAVTAHILIFSMALEAQEGPVKPSGAGALCQGFDKKLVTVDGIKVSRYVVPDPKYLSCVPSQPKTTWVVKKDSWTAEDEVQWQKFVRAIGESGCNTMDTCLASSANPYRDQIDLQGTQYADCADFPLYLRAYFSFRNNLPFSMVTGLKANGLNPEQQQQMEKRRQAEEAKGQLESFLNHQKDIRYSVNGNQPASRISVPVASGGSREFFSITRYIRDNVSTAHFRMFNTRGPVESDFYSPAITKESIRVGTVLYKVTGHVALVYDITPEGEVKWVDAHPDNSITRGSFNSEYVRSNPFQGGGFKNWRPFKLVANEVGPNGEDLPVKKNVDGSITTGRFKFLKDEEIADYSAEQYYGNKPSGDWDWKKGKFLIAGREVNSIDFVRFRLADSDFKLNPVAQYKKDLVGLCGDLQERTRSVQVALDARLNEKSHPTALPTNIYGAEGEWESFSTPGRDIRIRKRALDLVDNAREYMTKWLSKDPSIQYSGENLKRDLIKVYNEVDLGCRISYVNSKGQEIRMSLSTALNRVTRMSFDPYFCPERRWGALSEAELRSCVETVDKGQWYEFTQFLRNQVVRDPSEVMGYTLEDVKRISVQQKIDANENTSRFNILKALKEL